jgi:hypothetical protein
MHMTNRTTKVASAILIGSLAGALLTVEVAPLHAADNCLSGPKGAAPKGSHWYYRVDHATKRNCWYVRAEGGQARSANSSGTPALPQAETSLQPSVANARAEAAAADIGPSNGGAAEPARSGAAEIGQDPNPPAADNGPSTVASRWLDQTSPDAVNASTPKPADSGARLNSSTPPAAAAPFAAADMRPASPSGSVAALLLVIVGALALAALFGGIIFKFGSMGRNDRRDFGRDRRVPWDSTDVGTTIQSPPLATKAPTPRTGLAREHHETVIPDEIVQLLSKLSKEAAA